MAHNFNGGLCKFSRLIPPPAESKSSPIKKRFTPTPDLAEIYARIDKIVISLGKMSGTKTTFGGGRKYKFGFNKKFTDWKGTDWCGYEPNDPSSFRNCFTLQEGILKERSQNFLNWVNSELKSVTGHYFFYSNFFS